MLPPEEHQEKRLHWVQLVGHSPSSDWHLDIWEWDTKGEVPEWIALRPGGCPIRCPPDRVHDLAKDLKHDVRYWNVVSKWPESYSHGGPVWSGSVAAEINLRDAKIAELTAKLVELEKV